MEAWGGLLKRYSMSLSDQLDILWITVDACLKQERSSKFVVMLVRDYYQNDIVEEATILVWHKRKDEWDLEDPKRMDIYKQVRARSEKRMKSDDCLDGDIH